MALVLASVSLHRGFWHELDLIPSCGRLGPCLCVCYCMVVGMYGDVCCGACMRVCKTLDLDKAAVSEKERHVHRALSFNNMGPAAITPLDIH